MNNSILFLIRKIHNGNLNLPISQLFGDQKGATPFLS